MCRLGLRGLALAIRKLCEKCIRYLILMVGNVLVYFEGKDYYGTLEPFAAACLSS
jgi:hypothetical protein